MRNEPQTLKLFLLIFLLNREESYAALPAKPCTILPGPRCLLHPCTDIETPRKIVKKVRDVGEE